MWKTRPVPFGFMQIIWKGKGPIVKNTENRKFLFFLFTKDSLYSIMTS